MLFQLACTGDLVDTSEEVRPLEWAVDEAGPYAAGHRQAELAYTTRAGDSRTIVVHAWYPTEATSGDGVLYLDAIEDPEALGNAEPAAPWVYPVLVRQHGYQGYAGDGAAMARHFASHGWAVVAADHTDNTLADHQSPLPTEHFLHRPQDVTQALDWLADELEVRTSA